MGMLLRRYHPKAPEAITETTEKSSALSDLTVQELREIAKENGVTGYSGLDKAGLINALEE